MIGSIVGIIALSGCSKEVGTEAQLEQEVKELDKRSKSSKKSLINIKLNRKN